MFSVFLSVCSNNKDKNYRNVIRSFVNKLCRLQPASATMNMTSRKCRQLTYLLDELKPFGCWQQALLVTP